MDPPHCSVLQATDPHASHEFSGPLAFLTEFSKWEVMAGDQSWEESGTYSLHPSCAILAVAVFLYLEPQFLGGNPPPTIVAPMEIW